MKKIDTIKSDALAKALQWAAVQPQWWHDAGNLHPEVLEAIARHAFHINASETAETGCGLSTVMLSTIVDAHTCFTIAAGNSLAQVQNVPHLRTERVNFVIGPSQLTVPRHTFARPLDLVLIDGPHGFPFAHLEYFYFYQKIRKGGILVVDDIHIPTIRQLYDVLRDDKMWKHVEDVMTTAFFRRTEAPMFDPFGDGWERQQFNQRHFHSPQTMDVYAPGWRDTMPSAPGPLLGGDAVPGIGTDALNAEIGRLNAENAALKSSTSWRVTAPLRAIAGTVRKSR
ncbi:MULTISPECIES: class I SAM-dependent methyltransferase [unclassified Mesorhizobium]|uniref:class I SAM-dependent methyltransferase n=1 Tax=unclassified Mesorhizobium TaxID=325217 RepID=UPI00112E6171|nr:MULTISPECIES: class I SAM-dependent methyltransferase [unclassified Mesorhizobium]MCA0023552.1 class I SAM-dependent methyltransferase [Mesorhizobium sp. B263B1A]TPJ96330.1 class I SAM-dependent methyltransferase [Mesorhizobium sp. B2-5-12]TPK29465.1 class I SAM-dependent methyltransferase [Mesorhizobium sp. B2-5-6]